MLNFDFLCSYIPFFFFSLSLFFLQLNSFPLHFIVLPTFSIYRGLGFGWTQMASLVCNDDDDSSFLLFEMNGNMYVHEGHEKRRKRRRTHWKCEKEKQNIKKGSAAEGRMLSFHLYGGGIDELVYSIFLSLSLPTNFLFKKHELLLSVLLSYLFPLVSLSLFSNHSFDSSLALGMFPLSLLFVSVYSPLLPGPMQIVFDEGGTWKTCAHTQTDRTRGEGERESSSSRETVVR